MTTSIRQRIDALESRNKPPAAFTVLEQGPGGFLRAAAQIPPHRPQHADERTEDYLAWLNRAGWRVVLVNRVRAQPHRSVDGR